MKMKNTVSSEKIYFIRHKWKNNAASILRKEKYIAIHFNDKEHKRFESYSKSEKEKPNFKPAWDCFEELRKNGGMVVAQYDNTDGNTGYCYIGKVAPKTKIQFLRPLKNIGLRGYKALKIENANEISYGDFPILLAVRPRRGTICTISEKNRHYYTHAYRNEHPPFELEFMHPTVQEQMCVEWLRAKAPREYRLKYLIMRPGKDIETIDICGKTLDGKRLIAQVTYEEGKKKIDDKKESLKEFSISSRNSLKIMFSKEKEKNEDGIQYFNLERVWRDLKKDRKYKPMLKEMIGCKKF